MLTLNQQKTSRKNNDPTSCCNRPYLCSYIPFLWLSGKPVDEKKFEENVISATLTDFIVSKTRFKPIKSQKNSKRATMFDYICASCCISLDTLPKVDIEIRSAEIRQNRKTSYISTYFKTLKGQERAESVPPPEGLKIIIAMS